MRGHTANYLLGSHSAVRRVWAWLASPCSSKASSREIVQILIRQMVLIWSHNLYRKHQLICSSNLAEGLARISQEKIAAGMQVSGDNPIVGIEGRTALLQNLSVALKSNPNFFGASARPGGLVGKLFSFVRPF